MSLIQRCPWAIKEVFHDYHDREWGTPVHEDRVHFEFLVLEGAQAGLSWETVLKKRAAYRAAFANFEPTVIAKMPLSIVDKLMLNEGLIRNRAKLTSVLINAKLFLEVQREFGSFDTYIWQFVGNMPIVYRPAASSDYHNCNDESDALSKDLKKRGFKFVGTTIIYAHLQATGLVDEHHKDCFRAAQNF